MKKSTTSKFQMGGTINSQKPKFKSDSIKAKSSTSPYSEIDKSNTPKKTSGIPYAKSSAVESPLYKKGGSVKKSAKPKARKK